VHHGTAQKIQARAQNTDGRRKACPPVIWRGLPASLLEGLAAKASPIAKEASSNIASGRISVKSMKTEEKANF